MKRIVGAAEPVVDWWRDALCAQTFPDAFFPEKGESTRAALQVCASCPVQAECLAYALDHEPVGVWGGMSARERLRINRQRRAARGRAAA